LVTGGAGYIGSHCCKALAQAGWRVVTFDDLSRGWRDLIRWGPLIQGNLLDPAAVSRAFDEVRPDAVVHLAALSDIGESVREPERYHRTNVSGSEILFQEAARARVRAVIFSSSCAVYGNPQRLPISEDHPLAPTNPYGRSKLAGEKLLASLWKSDGLRYVALRYFNAGGADAEGDTGERHEPETHAIPLAIRAALRGDGTTFTVNGNDFDTRDGTALRDYVHVSDLADAHVKALTYLLDGGAPLEINLGGVGGATIKEILEAVEHITGKRVRHTIGPRRNGDPAALVASSARADQVLGWQPVRSHLENIVRTAYRWHAKEPA
jgi:UDP-arabinose 4-epimerase